MQNHNALLVAVATVLTMALATIDPRAAMVYAPIAAAIIVGVNLVDPQ